MNKANQGIKPEINVFYFLCKSKPYKCRYALAFRKKDDNSEESLASHRELIEK